MIKVSTYFAKYLAQRSCNPEKLLVVANIVPPVGGTYISGKLVDVMAATMGIVHSSMSLA